MRVGLALLIFIFASALIAIADSTAIRAGHVIDPETGTVAENVTVVIEDGKISAIGPDVEPPAGAEEVDLSSAWVLPGLMDAHTHLTLEFPPSGTLAWHPIYAEQSTGFRALRGVYNARIVLEAGFTTIKDIGNAGNYADTDMRKAIEEGWFPGPTIINAGKIIAPYGGQLGNVSPEQGRLWQYEYIDADSPEEVRKAVRRNLYYGAKTIKLVADDLAYYYSEEEIRAAVEEAHKAGVTVAVHANRDPAMRNAILAGADAIEHGWGPSDEILELMKEKGTFLVGTDFPVEHFEIFLPPDQAAQIGAQILDRLRRAHQIGVKMAFGTDVVGSASGKNRAEMMFDYLAVWKKAGVPDPDILKAMTTNAADLLGIADQRGRLQEGSAADIIATPDNPLQNIEALRKVQFVMKDGEIIRR